MLQLVKAELKNGIALSAEFFEGALERHVRFSSHLLTSSLASAKQMRGTPSLPDALKIPSQFVTQTQQDMLALGYANTQAMFDLGKECVARMKRSFASKQAQEPAANQVAIPVASVLPDIITATEATVEKAAAPAKKKSPAKSAKAKATH